jgi:hypothetical protein
MHPMPDSTASILRKNAVRFVEESIRYSRKSKRLPDYWPFAILNLVQALELFLKALLFYEHPVLIYENVDTKKRSVSLLQALDRLVTLENVSFDPEEIKIIRRASSQRNKFLHLEHDANPEYLESIYLNLFEFLYFFHQAHFETELHDHIDQSLWRKEAELIAKFEKQWVTYRGREVQNQRPLDILLGQKYNAVRKPCGSGYEFYERERFTGIEGYPDVKWCHDCNAEINEYHGTYCDIERCQICGNQLLLCLWGIGGCDVEYWIQKDKNWLRNG